MVSKTFIGRAIDYCFKAYSRHNVESILLIICVDTLHQDIKQHVTTSRFPGIFSFLCIPWALYYFMICEENIERNIITPPNPLIAYELFFYKS